MKKIILLSLLCIPFLPSAKAQSGAPTIEATLNWLKENFGQNRKYESMTFSVEADNCTVVLGSRKADHEPSVSITVPLKSIDYQSIQMMDLNDGWYLAFSGKTGDGAQFSYKRYFAYYYPETSTKSVSTVGETQIDIGNFQYGYDFGWINYDHAQKVLKAFKHAVKLCQGIGDTISDDWFKN
ncbi:MAG TPA: hypothetical protein PKB07_24885 [Flavilitoribacter sp.]|nr:hypothetical protein [Flavilitoribacter sp.]